MRTCDFLPWLLRAFPVFYLGTPYRKVLRAHPSNVLYTYYNSILMHYIRTIIIPIAYHNNIIIAILHASIFNGRDVGRLLYFIISRFGNNITYIFKPYRIHYIPTQYLIYVKIVSTDLYYDVCYRSHTSSYPAASCADHYLAKVAPNP